MGLFGSKKVVKATSKPEGDDKLAAFVKLLHQLKVGTRLRCEFDDPDKTSFENLLVGYALNDHLIFSQKDIDVSGFEATGVIKVKSGSSEVEVNEFESLYLLLPTETGAEKKLDYQTRATLGRNGFFVTGQDFRIVSLNNSKDNVELRATVARKARLEGGIHSGLVVSKLTVEFDSIESFDPRKQPRISINIPVSIQTADSDKALSATIHDFSYKEFRFSMAAEGTTSRFHLGGKFILAVKLSAQPIQLRCVILLQRDNGYVASIEQVHRGGSWEEFGQLDAMELKIAFVEYSD